MFVLGRCLDELLGDMFGDRFGDLFGDRFGEPARPRPAVIAGSLKASRVFCFLLEGSSNIKNGAAGTTSTLSRKRTNFLSLAPASEQMSFFLIAGLRGLRSPPELIAPRKEDVKVGMDMPFPMSSGDVGGEVSIPADSSRKNAGTGSSSSITCCGDNEGFLGEAGVVVEMKSPPITLRTRRRLVMRGIFMPEGGKSGYKNIFRMWVCKGVSWVSNDLFRKRILRGKKCIFRFPHKTRTIRVRRREKR